MQEAEAYQSDKRTPKWVWGIFLVIAAVSITGLWVPNRLLGFSDSTGHLKGATDAIPKVDSAMPPTASNSISSSESVGNLANKAAADPCQALLDRSGEIDSGSTSDTSSPTEGPIRTIDAHHQNEEYNQLKDCWRKAQPPPELDYGGMGEFQGPITLGMTAKALAQALPIDQATDPHMLHWLQNSCTPASGNRVPSQVAETCILSQIFPSQALELFGGVPDDLTIYLDGETMDSKLLGWSLDYSVPVEAYKTTDAVIRHERTAGALGTLGPPDLADEKSAYWTFMDGSGKTVETVSLLVHREGAAFRASLDVTDDKNWDQNREAQDHITAKIRR